MKVVVPFTEPTTDETGRQHGLRPEVEELLHDRADFVLLKDAADYHRLMAERWAQREDLCVIEQDVVPTWRDLEELESCRHWWCLCPYPGPSIHPDVVIPPESNHQGTIVDGLGCTRFRAELMAALPKLFEMAPEATGHQVHWLGQDVGISRVLKRHGFRSHKHRMVQHLTEYQAPPLNAVLATSEAREALRSFYQTRERWPGPDFVMRSIVLGAQASDMALMERGLLYQALAHSEDDLQAALEAVRTLRRAVVAIDNPKDSR